MNQNSQKKVKNVGRTVLIVGIFYTIILLIGALSINSTAPSEQTGQLLGMSVGGVFGVSWIVLGALIIKNNNNVRKAANIALVTLVVTIAALIYSLVRGNINTGSLIVLVLAIYLAISYGGLRKLSKTSLL